MKLRAVDHDRVLTRFGLHWLSGVECSWQGVTDLFRKYPRRTHAHCECGSGATYGSCSREGLHLVLCGNQTLFLRLCWAQVVALAGMGFGGISAVAAVSDPHNFCPNFHVTGSVAHFTLVTQSPAANARNTRWKHVRKRCRRPTESKCSGLYGLCLCRCPQLDKCDPHRFAWTLSC